LLPSSTGTAARASKRPFWASRADPRPSCGSPQQTIDAVAPTGLKFVELASAAYHYAAIFERSLQDTSAVATNRT
jgi:hypothetical protein